MQGSSRLILQVINPVAVYPCDDNLSSIDRASEVSVLPDTGIATASNAKMTILFKLILNSGSGVTCNNALLNKKEQDYKRYGGKG